MSAPQQALLCAVEPPAAGHRYWRLKSFTGTGSSEIYFYELQLWSSGSSRADTSGTTITTDMSIAFGSTANLVDGNVAAGGLDIFPFPTSGKFIKWDFGSGNAKNVLGFKHSIKSGTPNVTGFSIEYSDDDSAWTAAGSISGFSVSNDVLSGYIAFV